MSILSLPIEVVASVASAAFGAGGSWAVTRGQAKAAAETVARLNEEREAHALAIAELKSEVRHMKDSLDRIERVLGTK